MEYQFSFNEKTELIYIDEKPHALTIGSLIRAVIETDWNRIKYEFEQFEQDYLMRALTDLNQLKKTITNQIKHPALIHYFSKCTNLEQLICCFDTMETVKKTILLVMEMLVDVDRNTYTEVLFDLLYLEKAEALTEHFSRMETAQIVPFSEWVMPVYATAHPFPYLFETDDIITILFQELHYLCSYRFIARKCAYCRQFFWTRRANRIYCNRPVAGTTRTCAQVGPAEKHIKKRAQAYQKYWSRRAKLLKQTQTTEDKIQFRLWSQCVEPYRKLAKRNAISKEEMIEALDRIEQEIYPKQG